MCSHYLHTKTQHKLGHNTGNNSITPASSVSRINHKRRWNICTIKRYPHKIWECTNIRCNSYSVNDSNWQRCEFSVRFLTSLQWWSRTDWHAVLFTTNIHYCHPPTDITPSDITPYHMQAVVWPRTTQTTTNRTAWSRSNERWWPTDAFTTSSSSSSELLLSVFI